MSTTKTLLETGNLGAISAALQAGDVSARELAEHCLAAAAASDILHRQSLHPMEREGGVMDKDITSPSS